MKLRYILTFTLLAGVLFGAQSFPEDLSGHKYQRMVSFADKAFEVFSYEKAAKYYEEAFSLKASGEVAVKLAVCHQKLNDHREALSWYEKAMEISTLSREDMLNYGLVLASAGRYDDARAIMKDYVYESNWVRHKVKGFESLESFYHYQEAYSIHEAIFNTPESEFSPAFFEDGLVIVTSRSGNNLLSPKFSWDNSNFLDLYQVKDGEAPREMSRKLNTRYHEGPSVFFENDTKVVLTRNQYEGDNSRLPGEFVNHLKLFYSERKENGKWEKPVMLPFNKEGFSCGHPAVNEDGSELYFASDMGETGGTDIYKVTFDGKGWSEPVALENGINTEKDEMFPFYQDGKLYFASSGHAGLGGLDIFRADLRNTKSNPKNMGYPINTEYDDFGLVWSADGREGYFSSSREGGAGNDDIYEVKVFDYQLGFKLTDAETGEALIGTVVVTEQSENEVILHRENIGTGEVKVLRGAEIMMKGMVDGYESAEIEVKTQSLGLDDRELEYELKLKKEVLPMTDLKFLCVDLAVAGLSSQIVAPVKKGLALAETVVYAFSKNGTPSQLFYSDGASWTNFKGGTKALNEKLTEERIHVVGEVPIDNVLYGFDEYSISETASAELDKLVDFLSKNVIARVELTGFADSRGNSAYNLGLSEKRANAAREYLIRNGIIEERIVTKALGEEGPQTSCGEACTDAEHSINRRVEITVF